MAVKNPYEGLPASAFWRTGVAEAPLLAPIAEIYRPKFSLAEQRISTAGSCFAQHIGRNLRNRKFDFVDVEPSPGFLRLGDRASYGYGLYSARYGNVYSTRQLRQLFERANGAFEPRETVWERDGRFHDPFRPTIEPGGFASAEEVDAMRRAHLGRVAGLLRRTDVFCFTLGLTEVWVDKADGAVFPSCPGVIAGGFDADRFAFRRLTYAEVLEDFEAFMAIARSANPEMRFLLTVSPVPLTATASGEHVLVATIDSKSTLRAVAGQLAATHEDVDYFPAYEIIAGHQTRAVFYEPNLRGVSAEGVAHVMRTFFTAHPPAKDAPRSGSRPERPALGKASAPSERKVDQRLICEEELLKVNAP